MGEIEDPDFLLHKSINKHQAIYSKAEILFESIHNTEALPKKEEWKNTLRDIMNHTEESADAIHRVRRTIGVRRHADFDV